MPLSIFNKLRLGKASPTSLTLQLADKIIAYPKEIIEDILVKVDKFIFPVDFVIDLKEIRESHWYANP